MPAGRLVGIILHTKDNKRIKLNKRIIIIWLTLVYSIHLTKQPFLPLQNATKKFEVKARELRNNLRSTKQTLIFPSRTWKYRRFWQTRSQGFAPRLSRNSHDPHGRYSCIFWYVYSDILDLIKGAVIIYVVVRGGWCRGGVTKFLTSRRRG